jgi:GDPmannose 4,6-dehydratase
MTVALITGITGQDGFYLAKQLAADETEVWGLTRDGTLPPELSFALPAPAGDVREQAALDRAVRAAWPDEVYHLAAHSSVGGSWDDPAATGEVTGLGTLRLLEAVRRVRPEARVLIPSSSEVFGEPDRAPQDEDTPLRPVSPYGAAKAYAHHVARIYRQRHGLFVAVAILYNHESPRRPAIFVTRKITRGAVAIARGGQQTLALGNLDAQRDWGYAPEYTRAMRLMLTLPEPAELVIATGQSHRVRDWCERAFAHVGLDYRQHVTTDLAVWRPAEPVPLVGNSNQARRLLDWRPSCTFPELVDLMMEAELAAAGRA